MFYSTPDVIVLIFAAIFVAMIATIAAFIREGRRVAKSRSKPAGRLPLTE